MARFNLADVGGKAFLLPMAEQAYREVENSLRGHDSNGGQVLDGRLMDAEAGIRRVAKQLAEICNTEGAAANANSEIAMYEAGLLANGLDPRRLPYPERYADYYRG